ncbi:MAG: molybdopterin-dependent oxidoreductase [Pseudonocardia sp.]|nr:molybdopterin-dependent oxidoreductase [Pseudonocardia sp.]
MPAHRVAPRARRHDTPPAHHRAPAPAGEAPSRRKFLGFLVAAPTLAVAVGTVGFLDPKQAGAAIPSTPAPADIYDLVDAITDAARPTANLIKIVVHEDGTVSFDAPRSETGQGITTAFAMIIAEELDLPLDKVKVTLADARPELVFNQITGGSSAVHSMYTPIRVACAIAKGALLDAAAAILQDGVSQLTSREGLITGPAGTVLSYGELAKVAAVPDTTQVPIPVLKPASDFTIVGTPQGRVDALDIVQGRKLFSMDLTVSKDALPTMVCRAPTLKGRPKALLNKDEVLNMPGVTDVAVITYGVAVRARTFGQCIDAVRVCKVDWGKGTVEGESDESVEKKLKANKLPLTPALPGTATVDAEFTFAFAANSPMETNTAIADVRSDRAEIWSGVKVPIIALEDIAKRLGLPLTSVKVHVAESGGCFGNRLFWDAAIDAAEASQKMGKPVKLMWHRTDMTRAGRMHPMSVSTIRAAYAGGNVLTYQQNHTSVKSDYSHGFGEILTNTASQLPLGNYSIAQTIYLLTVTNPYNFGVSTQLLNEIDLDFTTAAMRNVYSPNVQCAMDLVVDQLAAKMGKDPLEFRREFVKNDLLRTVLDKAAEVGEWGRKLPDGVAQGIGMHDEYKNSTCCIAEIDTRPETVNRKVRNGFTGPRVTRVTFVTVPGQQVINPRGFEAQLQGCIMDAIGITLTTSSHLKDGHFLEGSWDNYFYTRQWNVPDRMDVVILPPDPKDTMAGAGEAGVAAASAAIACAYARATGIMPTYFPINHNRADLGFEVKDFVPPMPESPTDGLDHTR